jgi:hypothetical protein
MLNYIRTIEIFCATVVMMGMLFVAQTAQANEPSCQEFDRGTMDCWVSVSNPPRSNTTGSTGESTATDCVGNRDGVIPCELYGGYWNSLHQCYSSFDYDLASAPDDDVFVRRHGHEGFVMQCKLLVGGSQIWMRHFWEPAVPPPPPNPEILVDQAIGTMSVTASAMGVWPGGWFDENRQSIGAVGLPVWFWAKNPGPGISGVATASASTGSYMIFAQASLAGVTWSDDAGHSVECRLGSAPRVGETAWDSPSGCGWTYDQQGDYQVTAVTHIRVDWTSNYGRAGTRTYDLSGPTHTLRIGEIQVLSRR